MFSRAYLTPPPPPPTRTPSFFGPPTRQSGYRSGTWWWKCKYSERCAFVQPAPAPPACPSSDEDEGVVSGSGDGNTGVGGEGNDVDDSSGGVGDFGGGGGEGGDGVGGDDEEYELDDAEAEKAFSQGSAPSSPVVEVPARGNGAKARSQKGEKGDRKSRGRKPVGQPFDSISAKDALSGNRGELQAVTKGLTGTLEQLTQVFSGLASNQGGSSSGAAAAGAAKATERAQQFEAATVNQRYMALQLQLDSKMRAEGGTGISNEELLKTMAKCHVDL